MILRLSAVQELSQTTASLIDASWKRRNSDSSPQNNRNVEA